MTNNFEVQVGKKVVKTTTSKSEALSHAKAIRKGNVKEHYRIGETVTVFLNGEEVYRQTIGRFARVAR